MFLFCIFLSKLCYILNSLFINLRIKRFSLSFLCLFLEIIERIKELLIVKFNDDELRSKIM